MARRPCHPSLFVLRYSQRPKIWHVASPFIIGAALKIERLIIFSSKSHRDALRIRNELNQAIRDD